MNGHVAVDSAGTKWVRNSAERNYTHCVVITNAAGNQHAEWASSLALAERNASTWRKRSYVKDGATQGYTAEVIEAVCTIGQKARA